MRRYDPGDPVALRYTATDEGGAPVAVTGTLVVTPPGTGATPYEATVVVTSTGVLDAVIPASELDTFGIYTFDWAVSGGLTDAESGRFYVADDDGDDDLPPLASFDRFVRKIGYEPEGPEADRARELLDQASERVRSAAEKTWADEDTGAVSGVPRRVRSIVIDVAYRAFVNPEGLSQRTIGDSSKSWDRAGREGGEIVYLTDAERADVRRLAATSSLNVVTLVSPYSSAADLDVWAEVTAE